MEEAAAAAATAALFPLGIVLVFLLVAWVVLTILTPFILWSIRARLGDVRAELQAANEQLELATQHMSTLASEVKRELSG